MYYIAMRDNYKIKFFKYFVDDKKTFVKYFILSFIVGILELFGVALTYPFINNILSQEKINLASLALGGIIIAAFLIKNVFMIFYNALQADFTKTCEANINKKFSKFFIFGDYNSISQITFAKKTQIIGFLVPNTINNYLIRVLNLNVNIFIFVLIIVFLLVKFFIATCITLLCSLALLFGLTYYFKQKASKIAKDITLANEKMNQALNESMLNTKNIKILDGEEFFYKKVANSIDNYKKHAQDLLFYNSIPPYVTEPFIIIILLILLSIISIQNLTSSTHLVASYAVIISAIFRLAPIISRIQVNLTGVTTSLPQVKELVEYYEEFNLNEFEINQNEFYNLKESIELKNIDFEYNNQAVLRNVNIKINKGEFIGLAGASGSGKTTLIDIIAGLLKIKKGSINIDGKIVDSMPKLKIGYIPQEYNTISASIRENVAFGSSNINDNKVIEVLKKARLYDFITDSFKEGIYAEPFTDSTGFSQGQKQRLAIARALYLDPDIIILDEATSSLDLKTEEEICEVLNSLKGEKTIIAVAHRLSTIKSADRIFFMTDSTISDFGTFNELYCKNTTFKELVDLNKTDFIH